MSWELNTESIPMSRDVSIINCAKCCRQVVLPSRTSCCNRDIPMSQWHRQCKFISHSCEVYSVAEGRDKWRGEAVLCFMMIIRVPCWQRLNHFQFMASKVTRGVTVPWRWEMGVVHEKRIGKSLAGNTHSSWIIWERFNEKSVKVWARAGKLFKDFHNLEMVDSRSHYHPWFVERRGSNG